MDIFAVEVQRRATVARQRTCPIGDLLGPDRESEFLEYKSTLRWDIRKQRKGGAVEDAAIKTIAGFVNSDFGGTLLIGVADDGTVHGPEDDYATFSKRGQRGDQDLWSQHLQNLIRSRLAAGKRHAANPEGDSRPRPVVKIFDPTGSATWLIAEMDPGDPDILYGLCDLGMGFPELGYVSRRELESVVGGLGLGLERDLYWKSRGTLLEYADAACRAQRIVELEEVSA